MSLVEGDFITLGSAALMISAIFSLSAFRWSTKAGLEFWLFGMLPFPGMASIYLYFSTLTAFLFAPAGRAEYFGAGFWTTAEGLLPNSPLYLFLSANSFLNLSKCSFSLGSFYEGASFAGARALGADEGG